MRAALSAYYPEPVRLRRLAHWCRYFSGMGVYALKRAMLRDNTLYASTTFARSLRWGVQIAFMPVSYTHLGVYKRQALFPTPMSIMCIPMR